MEHFITQSRAANTQGLTVMQVSKASLWQALANVILNTAQGIDKLNMGEEPQHCWKRWKKTRSGLVLSTWH
jgi:hypothetical protein